MRTTILVAVPVIVLACGGDDDGSGAISAFIDGYCKELTPCCEPASDGKVAGSGCVTFHSFLSAGATYDGAAGNACLTEIRAGKSDPAFCSKVSRVAPSCNRVWKPIKNQTGTAGPGAPCESDKDCAPSAEGETKCTFDHPSTTGGANRMVCTLELPGKAGDSPCMGTKNGSLTSYVNGAPARAYVCDIATSYCGRTTNKCEPVKAAGTDCTGSDAYECGDPSTNRCLYQSPARKCSALKADGQACTSATECTSSQCTANVCTARSTTTSTGKDSSLLLVCSTMGSD